jgi:hypothetical protein
MTRKTDAELREINRESSIKGPLTPVQIVRKSRAAAEQRRRLAKQAHQATTGKPKRKKSKRK